MRIAAGLYPFFNAYQANPTKTLQCIQQIGYEGLEFYGAPLIPAQTLRGLLDQTGLLNAGYQVSWRLLQPQTLKETIKYQKQLGTKRIVIPALGGPWESGHKQSENTLETWMGHIEYMNQLVDILQQEGFELAYHTHDYDFSDQIEGRATSYELIQANTTANIQIEIDTGNCLEGGLLPEKEILQLDASRLQAIHCKPFSFTTGYEQYFGGAEDATDWSAVITACGKQQVDWLVIEPESITLGSPEQIMEQGHSFMQHLLEK